jgi:hypothetical protein
MYHRSKNVIVSSLATVLVCAASAYGQSSSGEVNGTITDPAGASVRDAKVTLVNDDTQITRTAVTNSKGDYTFINLPPGQYSLTISSSGFRDVAIPGFKIAVNQTFTQPVSLQVGGSSETVTVSAESAELLQRSSAELGTVIEERVVHDLPLNGRNFTELLTLTPGVTEVSTAQGSSVGTQDAGISAIPSSAFSKPSLHGQQNRSTLYYMDGVTNTDLRGPVYGVLPMVDSIQEFKVQSHDKAESGGVLGGVVNIVSKSGTNKLHGSVFEFVRNNFFDARDPFKDALNPGPAAFHQNEFGATLGGPIIHDRTFFFLSYEGWRYSRPTQTLASVPTAAEINGDFTAGAGSNLALYNPFTTVASGTKFNRATFVCDANGNAIAPNSAGVQTGGTACNKIPTQLINPFFQGLLKKYVRAPNYNVAGSVSNYVEDRANRDNANNYQIKIDHRVSAKTNVWARFTNMYVTDYAPVTGTIEFAPSDYHAYNWGTGFTQLITSKIILDAQAGILLKPYVFNAATTDSSVADIQGLGISDSAQWGGLYTQLASPYFSSAIGSQGNSIRKNPTWSASSNLTWLFGSHNAKVGVMYTNVQRVQQNLSQQFSFSGSTTSNPNPAKGAPSSGNILSSMLLALPTGYAAKIPVYDDVDFSLRLLSGFIEDEWKLNSRLTMTYGLRYDYLTVPKVLDGRTTSQLDLFNQTYTIGEASVPACSTPAQNPCIPGGLASVPHNDHINFAGFHKSFLAPKSSQFQPRIGLAYAVHPETVIRAGYGLYWDALPARSQYAQNQMEAATWPWASGFSGNANAIGATPTAFGSIEGHFPAPTTSASPWTQGGYYDDPKFKPAYSNQWNLEIQQQLGSRSSLSIAYVGSSNGNLDYTGNANAARTASPTADRVAEDSLRAIPWMVSNLHWGSSTGRSNYNALETRIMGEPTKNLRTILSFTWGKSIDNSSGYFAAENGIGGGSAVQNFFDPRDSRSVSSYNIKETVSFASIYDLPLGHGKAFLNHGIAAYVFGDWQANNVLRARTGQPFNLTVTGTDPANIEGSLNTLSGYARPNLTPGRNPIPAHRTVQQWFDPSAFSIPSGTFGNYSRNAMTGGPVWGDDFSMFKKIQIGERVSTELRFEGFNVFNVQSLSPPGAGNSAEINIGNSGTVGSISQVALKPRELQFGVRIKF